MVLLNLAGLWWTSQARQLALRVGLRGPSPRNEQAPKILNSQRLRSGYVQSWTRASETSLEERSSTSFEVQ